MGTTHTKPFVCHSPVNALGDIYRLFDRVLADLMHGKGVIFARLLLHLKCLSHEGRDIPQEEASNDAHASKRDGYPVRPLICDAERVHGCVHDRLVGCVPVAYGRTRCDQLLECLVLRVGTETNSSDELEKVPSDIGFGHDGSGDCVGEAVVLVEEDVVENGEANRATNVTDRESNGRDGADQVRWTDYLSNQGTRNDDGAHAYGSQRNDGVDGGSEVVCAGDRHGTDKCGHEDAPEDHKPAYPALEDNNKTKVDHRASNDTETDGKGTDTNLQRVISIDIVDLRGPEQEHDKEVAATEECNQQNGGHGALVAGEDPGWNHGVRCEHDLVYKEGDEKCRAQQESYENMGTGPFILAQLLACAA